MKLDTNTLFNIPANIEDIEKLSNFLSSRRDQESFIKWATKEKCDSFKLTKRNCEIIKYLHGVLITADQENKKINNKEIKRTISAFNLLFTACLYLSLSTKQKKFRHLYLLKKVIKDTEYLFNRLEGTLSEQKFKYFKRVVLKGHGLISHHLKLSCSILAEELSNRSIYVYPEALEAA